MLRWKTELNEKVLLPIGRTPVLLDGSCRAKECNLGNLIADSFVYAVSVSYSACSGRRLSTVMSWA